MIFSAHTPFSSYLPSSHLSLPKLTSTAVAVEVKVEIAVEVKAEEITAVKVEVVSLRQPGQPIALVFPEIAAEMLHP